MKAVRPSDQRVEVQGVHEGDSVLVYLPDGRRIMIEALHVDTTLSIEFGHTTRSIEVYDGEGEEVASLRPGGYSSVPPLARSDG